MTAMETTAERPIVEMDDRRSATTLTDRARARWSGVAGRLGMGFCLLGFFVIALAWNGAAGLDYAQGQLPYLISGGVGGLGLIVIGAAVMIAESNRRDRAILERKLDQLTHVLGRMAPTAGANGSAAATSGDMVVAGRSSYHRADCRLVEGRTDNETMNKADAEDMGLARCRICRP
jgi:hypothetical protein